MVQLSLLGVYPREGDSVSKRRLHSHVHRSNSQEMERSQHPHMTTENLAMKHNGQHNGQHNP